MACYEPWNFGRARPRAIADVAESTTYVVIMRINRFLPLVPRLSDLPETLEKATGHTWLIHGVHPKYKNHCGAAVSTKRQQLISIVTNFVPMPSQSMSTKPEGQMLLDLIHYT